MAQVEMPDRYMPYRLFTYSDRNRAGFIRPEQVVGTAMDYRNEKWIVEITLRENLIEVNFDPNEETAARDLVSRLHEFLEADALRNQHNAALKKGKTHE
jgi:hypothetical protein